MAGEAFEAIMAGLEDAIAYAKGDATRGVTSQHPADPLDVAAVRRKTRLSRAEFARTFGVSKATLARWERGERRPVGVARVLLKLIDRKPEAVMDAVTA